EVGLGGGGEASLGGVVHAPQGGQGVQGLAFTASGVLGEHVHVVTDEGGDGNQGVGLAAAQGAGGHAESLVAGGGVQGGGQDVGDQVVLAFHQHAAQAATRIAGSVCGHGEGQGQSQGTGGDDLFHFFFLKRLESGRLSVGSRQPGLNHSLNGSSKGDGAGVRPFGIPSLIPTRKRCAAISADQAEKFAARGGIAAELAKHHRGDHGGVLLLHAAHH